MDTIKCPKCGAELDGNYSFCPFCGSSLEESNENDDLDVVINTCKDIEWVNTWKRKASKHNFITCLLYSVFSLLIVTFGGYHLIKKIQDCIDVGVSSGLVVLMIIGTVLLIGGFIFVPILMWIKLLKPKTLEKNIEGYTVLVCQAYNVDYLICDGNILDSKNYYAQRDIYERNILKGRLPNGTKIWAEFEPTIIIHVGEKTEYKD